MPYTSMQKKLFSLSDPVYKDFNKKLIPNIDTKTVIGIRIPVLRAFAKDFFKTNRAETDQFMNMLPHFFFEENNLHAFFIECLKDFDEVICAAGMFLPYIDNWQTCDIFSPPVFKKFPDKLYGYILRWLESPHEYTVRFAIEMLLRYYLDERFKPEMLELVCSIQSDSYYVRMMAAWYFSIALVKQWDTTLPYFAQQRLEPFTLYKAIQKACESRQLSPEQKTYLKTLRKSFRPNSPFTAQ